MSSTEEESDVESFPPPIYNRQEIITSLTTFYTFLSTLPYIPSTAILHPPPTGWPNITVQNFSALGKNEEVVNLLKHLPYIDLSEHQYMVAPETYFVDYCGEEFQREVSVESVGRCWPLGDVEFPSWAVNLTFGSRDGMYLMLDTTDGTVTEYNIQDTPEERYDEGDPRSWRNQCEGEARPLGELLGEWKEKYYNLKWMGFSMNGWPSVMWADPGDCNYEDVKQMRKIIRKHGWPDSFERESCRQALIAWDEAK